MFSQIFTEFDSNILIFFFMRNKHAHFVTLYLSKEPKTGISFIDLAVLIEIAVNNNVRCNEVIIPECSSQLCVLCRKRI